MTFSGLIKDNVGTKKYSSRLGQKIEYFILHHTAGGTLESNTKVLATDPKRFASCTYLLNTDGKYRGVVPEEYRPWTSGNGDYDRRAITQETINTTGAPKWEVSEKQIEATAAMLADVAERYNWPRITVRDKYGIWGHKDIPGAATACPGPFLYPQLEDIAKRAREILKERKGEAKDKNEIKKPVSTPKIADDGWWGVDTTRAAQRVLGTPVDGKVSNQPKINRRVLKAAGSGWEWTSNPTKGSALIRAMQKIMNEDGQYTGTIDGFAGPLFVRAFCTRFKEGPDTLLSGPSPAVKAMQRKLNSGKF